MSAEKDTGELKIIPDNCIKQIEWRIPNFFSATAGRSYVTLHFSIGDDMWQLKLYLNWEHPDDKFMHLSLKSGCNFVHPVEYYSGIRKFDGILKSDELLCSGFLNKDNWFTVTKYLISKEELMERKSHLVPGDVLTIFCTMKFMNEAGNPIQRATLNEAKQLKWRGLEKLSSNFRDLFMDKDSCDVTLKVEDKEFKAHRLVLMARSKVLAANFKHDTLEKQTGIIIISDCDPDYFHEFLEYLYSGELQNLSFTSAISLYYTADKYDVEELKTFCVEYMMQCLSVENICEIAVLADKYDETQLISCVEDFFSKNCSKIFERTEWKHLMGKDSDLANKLLIAMAKVRLQD